MNADQPNITLSIVSHQQQALVNQLLDDLDKYAIKNINVILTLNIEESISFDITRYHFPIKIIRNQQPKGFGGNHNQAFAHCDAPYFCVINPDVRLTCNPFPVLISKLDTNDAGLVAPLVLNVDMQAEDSVRKFPTLFSVLKKIFIKKRNPDYPVTRDLINPDWVAGMFMLFKSVKFKAVEGFDEVYFLYYEDVDICRSLHQINQKIIFTASTSVIHVARRASHKNIRYLYWHVKSMLVFYIKWLFK